MAREFSSMQLDALQEVTNIGVGNAATALSTLLGTKFEITVPSINMVELNSLINDAGESIVYGVVVRVVGDISGSILIVMDSSIAKELVSFLLGKEQKDELDEMGISVLCEVGNILSGSYMNAIAKFTGLFVNASVPAVACDMLSAIYATTFIESGQFDEYILDLETVFLSNNEINKEFGMAHFYYIPAPGSLEKVLKSIGIS